MGLGGKLESRVGTGGSFLTALDYKTGKAAWRYKYRGRRRRRRRRADDRGQARVRRRRRRQHRRARRLSPASRCGTRSIGSVTNPPQTYLIDGRQYLLVASGDTLYAFVMY